VLTKKNKITKTKQFNKNKIKKHKKHKTNKNTKNTIQNKNTKNTKQNKHQKHKTKQTPKTQNKTKENVYMYLSFEPVIPLLNFVLVSFPVRSNFSVAQHFYTNTADYEVKVIVRNHVDGPKIASTKLTVAQHIAGMSCRLCIYLCTKFTYGIYAINGCINLKKGRKHGNPCRRRLGRGSNMLGRDSNMLGRGCNELGMGSTELGRCRKGRSHTNSKSVTDRPTDRPTQ